MSTTVVTEFKGQAAVALRCWCSVSFAVPQSLHDVYIRNNANAPGSFSLRCPLGHSMIPAAKDPLTDLRDEVAREKQRREQAEAHMDYLNGALTVRSRQLAARKGQLTKMRNRVANGVCPCCNRHFSNLHRHMENQHPDWHPEADEAIGP